MSSFEMFAPQYESAGFSCLSSSPWDNLLSPYNEASSPGSGASSPDPFRYIDAIHPFFPTSPSPSGSIPPTLCTRTGKKPRKQHDPTRIRRPRNAFIVFRSAFIHAQRQQCAGHAGPQNELSQQAAVVWNAMDAGEKRAYQDIAKAERDMHKLQYPDYKYLPEHAPKGKRSRKGTLQARSLTPVVYHSPVPSTTPISHHHDERSHSYDPKCEPEQLFFTDALPPSYQYGADTSMFNDYNVDTSFLHEETLPCLPQDSACGDIDWSFNIPDTLMPTTGGDDMFMYGVGIDNFSPDLFQSF